MSYIKCPIHKILGAITPYFVSNAGKIKYSEDEHVVLKLHQTNATLSCKVDGQPTPEIKWIFDNKVVTTFSLFTNNLLPIMSF